MNGHIFAVFFADTFFRYAEICTRNPATAASEMATAIEEDEDEQVSWLVYYHALQLDTCNSTSLIPFACAYTPFHTSSSLGSCWSKRGSHRTQILCTYYPFCRSSSAWRLHDRVLVGNREDQIPHSHLMRRNIFREKPSRIHKYRQLWCRRWAPLRSEGNLHICCGLVSRKLIGTEYWAVGNDGQRRIAVSIASTIY